MKGRRNRTVIAAFLIAALLMNTSVFAAAPLNDTRLTAFTQGEEADFDLQTKPVYEDLDFDEKEGNMLIAANPSVWECTDASGILNAKILNIGSLEGGEARSVLHSHQGAESGSESSDHSGIRECGSLKHAMKRDVTLEKKVRTGSEGTVNYQVGDVYLRNVDKESAGVSDNDYTLTTDTQSVFIPRLYQCLYVGESTTIWGSVEEDEYTEAEEEKVLKAFSELQKIGESEDEDDRWQGYNGTGFIGTSDDTDRTVVDYDDVQEIGPKFDIYIKKESEYTGDYHVTDREYGDNDGKAAFLFEPIDQILYDPEDPEGYTTYGYFWNTDLDEYCAGKHTMDCLHLNYYSCFKSEDHLYTTVLHEMQHYILEGYSSGISDLWIDEWLAQGVSMQVYGQDSEDVKEYVSLLPIDRGFRFESLLGSYAFGEEQTADREAYLYTYSVAYPLSQYFIEHVDPRFVKTFTEKIPDLNTVSLSDYLKKNTAHSLEGWLAAFGIAFTAGMEPDGKKAVSKAGDDFELGDSTVFRLCREYFDTDDARERMENNNVLKSFSDLSEPGSMMAGGGQTRVFLNSADRTVHLKDVEEGIVWALRNSQGEIVSVGGLEALDEIDRNEYVYKTVSSGGTIPVTINIKILGGIDFRGSGKPTADDIDMRVTIGFKNDAVREKINIAKIGLGTLSFKNYSKAFVYEGSKEKKRPYIKGLKLKALPGASKDEKTLVKEVNSALKNGFKSNYMYFNIYPCPIDEAAPKVTLSKKQDKIKKAECIFGGKKYKLKKSDYKEITTDGKVTGIEGTGNFTGTWELYNGKRVVKE